MKKTIFFLLFSIMHLAVYGSLSTTKANQTKFLKNCFYPKHNLINALKEFNLIICDGVAGQSKSSVPLAAQRPQANALCDFVIHQPGQAIGPRGQSFLGLSFSWPSDTKAQETKAYRLVHYLHQKGLKASDVYRDHLNRPKQILAHTIVQRYCKTIGINQREHPKISDHVQTYINTTFQKLKEGFPLKSEVIFKGSFSKELQNLVSDTFKELDVSYSISVRWVKKSSIYAQVTTYLTEKSLSLDLPWKIWGDGDGCKNIAIRDRHLAKAIIAHEATHVKREHGIKEWAVLIFLEKINCSKPKIEEITTLIKKCNEWEADLLPFMTESTAASLKYQFRKFIEDKKSRSSKYLQLDNLSKIIALDSAERTILQANSNRDVWSKNIEIIFIHNQAHSLLHSPLIPVHMKAYALNKIVEATLQKNN